MSKLFISHSSQDDGFVRDLRQALGNLGQDVWIDSRELRGGDPLWPEIQKAIEEASAYAVVVSPDALQSKWIGKELRWYLEKYAGWPSEYFRDRARKVEESLVQWGRLRHKAALPVALTANVINAWARIDGHAGRRFSVHVDASLEAGTPADDVMTAHETATLLPGLPWELLHDGESFLFQGVKPTRVRRRLPNTNVFDVPVVATPIRILLVTARPEDDACGYIDHRASALPLVEAMEVLGGLVRLHALNPSTLLALREELDRAQGASRRAAHGAGDRLHWPRRR